MGTVIVTPKEDNASSDEHQRSHEKDTGDPAPFSHARYSQCSREDGSCQDEQAQVEREHTKEKNRSPRIEEHWEPTRSRSMAWARKSSTQPCMTSGPVAVHRLG